MAAYSDAQLGEALQRLPAAAEGPFQPFLRLLLGRRDPNASSWPPEESQDRRSIMMRVVNVDRFGRFLAQGTQLPYASYQMMNMPGWRLSTSGRLGAQIQAVSREAQREYNRIIVNLVTRLRLWLAKARGTITFRRNRVLAYDALVGNRIGMLNKRRRL